MLKNLPVGNAHEEGVLPLLDSQADMPSLDRAEGIKYAELLFEIEPNTVTVRRWDERYLGDAASYEANYETVALGKGALIEAEPGYVYEVQASWTSRVDFGCEAQYGFLIQGRETDPDKKTAICSWREQHIAVLLSGIPKGLLRQAFGAMVIDSELPIGMVANLSKPTSANLNLDGQTERTPLPSGVVRMATIRKKPCPPRRS